MTTKATNTVLNLTDPPIDDANLIEVALYSVPPHSVVIGQGTDHVTFAAPGTIGHVLHSNGPDTDPSFAVLPPPVFPPSRDYLTVAINYYVDVNLGNDANDGTTPGAGAWQTLQHSWDQIQPLLDLAGFTIVVNVADGTYSSIHPFTLLCQGQLVGQNAETGSLLYTGNVANPSACVITNTNGTAVQAGNGAAFFLQGFTISAVSLEPGVFGRGIAAVDAAIIHFNHLIFGFCTNYQIDGEAAGVIQTPPNAQYTISGGAAAHINAHTFGNVTIDTATVTITGNPTFTNTFVNADENSVVTSVGTSWIGTCNGLRYVAHSGAQIDTQGSGPNYFPGTSPGTSDIPSLYT